MDVDGLQTFVWDNAAGSVWSADAVAIILRFEAGRFSITGAAPDLAEIAAGDVVLAIDGDLCRRTFGIAPSPSVDFRLPNDMRAIGIAIRNCGLPDDTKRAFHLAKSIELACCISVRLRADELVPADAGDLSEHDARRIMAARHIIEERWHEKLTLASLARASGLNRAKLTRGFRSMFACSVADVIADRRMSGARQLIVATDLPIASIGLRCGYLNNASFTRAFSRRFGLAPTRLRGDCVGA